MSLPRVLHWPSAPASAGRLGPPVARTARFGGQRPTRAEITDPGWVRDNAFRIDVAHVHTGWEDLAISRVVDVVATLRACGVPVVWTVDHLQPPALPAGADQAMAALDAASPHVARMTTLTPGAAAVLGAHLDRPVEVIPHGPLLDAPRRRGLRLSRDARPLRDQRDHVLVVVGPTHRWTRLDELVEVAAARTRRRLRVLLHRDQQHVHADALELAAGNEDVDVVVHDGLRVRDVAHELVDAAAVVLPHLRGTHSALAELAGDVGVPVVPTDCGHVGDQLPHDQVIAVRDGRLVQADVEAVLDGAGLPPGALEEDRRRAEQQHLAGHVRLYRRTAEHVVRLPTPPRRAVDRPA